MCAVCVELESEKENMWTPFPCGHLNLNYMESFYATRSPYGPKRVCIFWLVMINYVCYTS